MRPLWRNALWLAFAAGCGAAGFWYGFDWGAEVTHSLHFQNRVSDDIAEARRALVELARRDAGDRAYAESNLRIALYDIGQITGGKPWWACYPRYSQTLAAAGQYLKQHPSALDPRLEVGRALGVCPTADGAPAPPIADGEYRFEIRDPEFPTMAGLPARATVDERHLVLVTIGKSARFEAGTRFEGELTWHAGERKWILAASAGDARAAEVGGCSDGQDVIVLVYFVLWSC
jgi:hypothetical protein